MTPGSPPCRPTGGCSGRSTSARSRSARSLPNDRSRFSSNPSPSIYTWIDGYSLSNFRLGFRTGDFNIYAWVRNAFDVKYFDQLVFGPGNTGLIAGNVGDPRTWGGTIKVSF